MKPVDKPGVYRLSEAQLLNLLREAAQQGIGFHLIRSEDSTDESIVSLAALEALDEFKQRAALREGRGEDGTDGT